jgi:hypothetical protein
MNVPYTQLIEDVGTTRIAISKPRHSIRDTSIAVTAEDLINIEISVDYI